MLSPVAYLACLVLAVLCLLQSASSFLCLETAVRAPSRVLQMKEVLGDPKSWNRPKKTMIIYEYEQSPLCKKVRMACSALDLIVEYRPCPGGTYGFSDQLKQRTLGSDTVPFLYDPGNSVQTLANIYDAGEIIEYLFENFGPGVNKIPGNLKAKGTTKSTSGVKPAKNYDESNMFKKALTLYGFEGGDIQKVRETLSSLCLAHVMVNVAKGSANRATLDKKGVKTPFLQDPNTRKEFEGAKECIAYLTATYTK